MPPRNPSGRAASRGGKAPSPSNESHDESAQERSSRTNGAEVLDFDVDCRALRRRRVQSVLEVGVGDIQRREEWRRECKTAPSDHAGAIADGTVARTRGMV